MATRMQQRRGTATMWTNANPILGVAEIGYETNTNKFKIGDGTNRWSDLNYFVDLDTMIEGAPGLLNSLDEIAAAIGDDPAFFTTIASGLATKAPLASPALTGTPTAPTAAADTNTTQIATTAFVADAVSGLGGVPLADVLLVGNSAGATDIDMSGNSVLAALRYECSGTTGQVRVGTDSGLTSQGSSAVAIGNSAGNSGQLANAVAVGVNAGRTTQGSSAVAIGRQAGQIM